MASSKLCSVVLLIQCCILAFSDASMDGQEFEFVYTGQMKYAGNRMHTQRVGLAFRASVRVQKVELNKYALKMQDLELAFANTRDLDTWQDEEKLKYEKNSKLAAMVERPFIMKFAENSAQLNGSKFHHLEVPAADPLWSVNLKKGLASFVNVFLPTNDAHSYISRESTIYGDCNTYWNVQHHPHWSDPQARVLNLSRVINFDECVTVPYKIYGSLGASSCTTCDEMKTHPLETMSESTYSFVSKSGDRSDLILEEARGFSKLEHAPYTENGNVVKLFTRQNLRLKSTKVISEKLEITGDNQIYQNLNMEFDKDRSLRRGVDMKSPEGFVEFWGLPRVKTDIVIIAMEKLSKQNFTAQQSLEGAPGEKSSSELFLEAITSMNLFDYSQTEEVYKSMVAAAPEEKKLKMQGLFVEIAASAGHNSGVLFIIEKFKSGEIDTRFLESFFKNLRIGLKDRTETALKAFLDFCRGDLMQDVQFEHYKTSCLLMYSSMMNEACRFPDAAPQFNTAECTEEILQKEAFRELIPDYEDAKKDVNRMTLFINIAANLQTKESAEFLLKVIKDTTVASLTKLDAAHALMKILPKNRDVIRQQATKIFLDRRQPTDLRIMTSVILFESKPALSLLQALAERLVEDKNDQVRTFVVSMIKEIDSSDYPCLRELRQNLRYIAPWISSVMPAEWKRKDFLTSHMKLSTTYDPKYDMGSHFRSSIVMGDSYVPREISYSFGQYFANFLFDAVSITVRQQGMDSLVDHAFGPRSMGFTLGSNLWSLGGGRRLTRSPDSVKQKISKIDSTMNIKTKKYDPMRLEITVGAHGHSLEVASLNETILTALMSPDYVPGTLLNQMFLEDVDEVHHSNARDFTLVMPTPFGIPAWLDVKTPITIYRKSQGSSLRIEQAGAMRLKLNQHFMLDVTLVETIGFDVPQFGYFMGVGSDKNLKINLPLNLDVDLNLASGKLTLNEEIKLPRDFLRHSFVPYTSLAGPHDQWSESSLNIYKEEELMEFEKVLPVGGLTMKLRGKTLPNDPFSFKNMLGWTFDDRLGAKINELLCNPKWFPQELTVSFDQPENAGIKEQTFSIRHKMTPPTIPEKPKSLFTEHIEDLANSFTHVVQVSRTLRGEADRQSDFELRYSYTPKRDAQWLHMFFAGQFSTSDQKKMCWASKMKRTLTDWSKRSVEGISKINADQKIGIVTDINFGKDCDANSTIHIDMTYEHSQQQREWLDELVTGTTRTRVRGLKNPYMKLYQRCIKWLAKGLVLPVACHKFIIHTSQLNQLTLEITGGHAMRLEDSPFITGAPEFMRSKLGSHLTSLKHLPSPRNKIRIKSAVREPCIDQRVADVEIEALHYKLRFDGLPVSRGAHWAPITATHMGVTNLQSYFRKYYNRYCDHQRKGVRTFDRVFFDVPETTCWKILAEDCSEQKMFTLLTKDAPTGDKDIKLLVDTHEIDITHTDKGIEVTIDGVQQEKTKEEESKVVENERGHFEFAIERAGPGMILNAPVFGIYIVSHTSSVFVQVAPFYRGKLCGLCGNFDLYGENDFFTTDRCQHHTEWSFAQNYVIPDAQCTMPPRANATEKTDCV